MKYILSLSLTVFCISFARADLSLEMGVTLPNSTNLWVGTVDRIKGNQCREDEIVMCVNTKSHVLNLDTGEGFKLISDKKMAMKTYLDQSMRTNVIAIDAIKDTGKAELVNGYDTKIYTLTNSNGASYTLWIAGVFPDLEMIKKDLAKRDRLHEATQVGFLHLSTLPGILLKCHLDNIPTNTEFQVVINEEPINPSFFVVPRDYHFDSPQPVVNTNTPVVNTNQVISSTNEPPTK